MKIKALTSAAGNDFAIAAGETADLPDYIAKDLVKAGYAIEAGRDMAEEPKKPGRPKAT